MRFVLDEDVDAQAVDSAFRQHGHECWGVVLGRHVQLETVELFKLYMAELVAQIQRHHIGVIEIRLKSLRHTAEDLCAWRPSTNADGPVGAASHAGLPAWIRIHTRPQDSR